MARSGVKVKGLDICSNSIWPIAAINVAQKRIPFACCLQSPAKSLPHFYSKTASKKSDTDT